VSDLDRKEHLAAEARQLLENPMLVGALAEIERKCYKAWEATTPMQKEEREKAWLMLAGMKSFKRELTKIINGGKIAASQAKQAQLGDDYVESDLPSTRRSVREPSALRRSYGGPA